MRDIGTDEHQGGRGESVREVLDDLREEQLGAVGVRAEIPLALLRESLLGGIGEAEDAQYPVAHELVLLGHLQDDKHLQRLYGRGRVPAAVRALRSHHRGQRLQRHDVSGPPVRVARPCPLPVPVWIVEEAVLYAGVQREHVPL